MIECEDPEPNVKHDARVREMYLVVMKKFLQVKKKTIENGKKKERVQFYTFCCGLGLGKRWKRVAPSSGHIE
jgi:hypothetical protein